MQLKQIMYFLSLVFIYKLLLYLHNVFIFIIYNILYSKGIIYNPCGGPCEGTPTDEIVNEKMKKQLEMEKLQSAKYKSLQYMRKKADAFVNNSK